VARLSLGGAGEGEEANGWGPHVSERRERRQVEERRHSAKKAYSEECAKGTLADWSE
jgi:hypothetical protein